MLPKFDGLSDTTQSVFRSSPLHVQRGGQQSPMRVPRQHELTGSANWASCGKEYGNWARIDPRLENSHVSDLHQARNYSKFGAVNFNRSASDPRIATMQGSGCIPAGLGQGHIASGNASGGPAPPMSGRSTAREMEEEVLATERQLQTQQRRPGSFTHTLRYAGDTQPAQCFPGAPGSSIGLHTGMQAKWGFERVPSLLHSHLERDCGRFGRSCAGAPPRQWQIKASDVTPLASGRPGSNRAAAGHGAQSASTSPQRSKSVGGLQGIIGMTWDGAAVSAGGSLRGSDGKYLGH